MQIRVLFFGMLKDLAGRPSESLSLPDGSTAGDLLARYEEEFPRLKDLWPSIALAVNQQYASSDTALSSNDEIALLPPVSGGVSCTEHAAIVREPINTRGILAKIKKPEDGAAILFEGVVRNNTRGRKTLYLEYEAYEAMALQEMEQLHRAAAFEACRWLIDTLKRKVPIWKKEYFVDGAVWADGEPFPADIPRAQGSPSGQPASK
jgi:molybdopterin synthase catalytic subunit